MAHQQQPRQKRPRHHHDDGGSATADRNLLPVPPNKFVGPYMSPWLKIWLKAHPDMNELLTNLNCSHFSVRGQAPTLLELKQHAQALLILIKAITISIRPTSVDDEASAAALTASDLAVDTQTRPAPQPIFGTARPDPANAELHEETTKAEAFDFLSSLQTRYSNPHPTHQIALTGLLNTIEDMGILSRHGRDHCPLHKVALPIPSSTDRNQQPLPYATNIQLITHADELLTRLDHEFSAEGGLLGMLPLQSDSAPNASETHTLAQRSILGQWLTFTRTLVTQNHELSQNLSAALEITAGEAMIPKQVLYDNADKLMYYQSLEEKAKDTMLSEKFIINIQPGKKAELEKAFDALEAKTAVVGDEAAMDSITSRQGLINLSVQTTYSRMRGGTTIFITPTAIAPAAPMPSIVEITKGGWRERSSLWEMHNNDELCRLKEVEQKFNAKELEYEGRKQAIEVLMLERKGYLLAGGGTSGRMGIDEEVKARMRKEVYGEEVKREMERFEMEKKVFDIERKALVEERKEFERMKRKAEAEVGSAKKRVRT